MTIDEGDETDHHQRHGHLVADGADRAEQGRIGDGEAGDHHGDGPGAPHRRARSWTIRPMPTRQPAYSTNSVPSAGSGETSASPTTRLCSGGWVWRYQMPRQQVVGEDLAVEQLPAAGELRSRDAGADARQLDDDGQDDRDDDDPLDGDGCEAAGRCGLRSR